MFCFLSAGRRGNPPDSGNPLSAARTSPLTRESPAATHLIEMSASRTAAALLESAHTASNPCILTPAFWKRPAAPPPYVSRETSKPSVCAVARCLPRCLPRPPRCLHAVPPCLAGASRRFPLRKRHFAPPCPENRTLREKRLFFYVGLCYTIKT